MAGFSTAVTGLKASTTMLDVAGNNIANSSTIGFKASRTEFGDIYATAVVGAGSANVAGSGVTVTDIAQDFKAGTIEFTNNNLDLAINGSGFFQLDDGQGGVTYTRAGAFELDKEGFIVSKTGKYLQGYGLDEDGNRLPIGNLAVTQKESPPKATESIDLSFNIDSRKEAAELLPTYDKDEPGSFTYTTTVRTFDSLGNEHTIKFNFAEQRPVREVFEYDVSGDADDTVYISGLPLDTSADFSVASYSDYSTFAAANPALSAQLDDIAARDARIDKESFTLSGGTLSFETFAQYTDSGDMVVTDVDPLLTTAVSYDRQNASTPTRAANEVRTYTIDETAGDSTVEIGGVTINVAGLSTKKDIAETIEGREAEIIDRNPAIESVQAVLVGGEYKLQITFKADEGNVDDADYQPTSVAGTLALESTAEGDNSYLGVYRMYAYLNGEEQLDIGKLKDWGEAGGGPAVSGGGGETEEGPILVEFNPTNGLLSGINGLSFSAGGQVPSITISGADPANPLTTIDLDLTNSTQFASASIVKSQLQDGYTKGDLIGVTFASTGEMVASFSNGQNQSLGVVAVATFENQAGLQPNGDTEWAATLTSGDAILNPPGTGLNGTLRSAALEASNVDLSAELVKLIEGQRNFQANSKTLETLNTVTQAILQI
ncbi:hypothetical protein GCM10011352_37580 [Marinobacterium zhoushanense]|uniref:Flagellar hook protein FlgE n=1 Tax=Marinobacterium zhoushanense TaxID=1679163 RepID=A0ABQ1KVM5_9GAMM|nr:flagellar hook-basal body complex protein [Marinobacterium zhoushanense]GGC07756.1 hypothetical protein GCM10011352_37580 [Marinobacterium zhoushanense]